MDTVKNGSVPLIAASTFGGNNHMRTTHIVNTIDGDRKARLMQRISGNRFPGDFGSFPIPGHNTGVVPPGLASRLDSMNPTLAARIRAFFGA